MLKALVKKQFSEIFKGYFVNQKTGKVRSKGGIIALFSLFAFLMLFLCAMFGGMGFSLSGILKIPGFEWLFFAIMDIVAILFGLLGSVFNTYASLYLAKDNDLLLSMPIKPENLLISRLVSVVGLALLYSGSVMIPASIVYLIFGAFNPIALIFQILLVPLTAVFISVLTCILGFVIALISTKLKNKSFITVIISLVFFGLYYFFCFKMSDIITSIVNNTQSVGKGIKTWGNLLYQLGMAANGDVRAFLLFTVLTVVSAFVCFKLLSKTFTKFATVNKGEKKVAYKKGSEKQSSVDIALLKKEAKRFTSSATYMLNCGLSLVMLPIIAVFMLIKRNDILGLVNILMTELPTVYDLLPLFAAGMICVASSMCYITTPSVSLEGKTLWIYRSLPVDSYKILNAKINLQFYISALPILVSSILIGIAFGFDFTNIVYITVLSLVFALLSAILGLIIGLLKPNLNWVSETTPIKQSMAIFISMLLGFIIPALTVLAGFLLRHFISATNFMLFMIVIFAICSRLLNKWLMNKGAKIFENL